MRTSSSSSPGVAVEPLRNDAVEVLVIVLAGSGTATVDAETIDLAPTMGRREDIDV
jgi:hypothetical protein